MERKDLKFMLPRGAQKEIAQLAGVSQTTVSLYLNGRCNSRNVELATIAILEKYSVERKQILDRIKSIA